MKSTSNRNSNLVTGRGLAQILAKVIELEALLPQQTEESAIAATTRLMRYWRTRQATARLMPAPDGSTVAFGCKVAFLLNGQLRSISIVGDDEAQPAAGLLAFTAPLCRAMLSAEAGDTVEFYGKADAIEIVAITVTSG
jgi:transcription elongation GreA/GreB family factor